MSKFINHNLAVAEVPIGLLKPSPNNARTHTKREIKQVAASITQFGFTNPIIHLARFMGWAAAKILAISI